MALKRVLYYWSWMRLAGSPRKGQVIGTYNVSFSLSEQAFEQTLELVVCWLRRNDATSWRHCYVCISDLIYLHKGNLLIPLTKWVKPNFTET